MPIYICQDMFYLYIRKKWELLELLASGSIQFDGRLEPVLNFLDMLLPIHALVVLIGGCQ